MYVFRVVMNILRVGRLKEVALVIFGVDFKFFFKMFQHISFS